jgi:hypothetical protein
MGGVICLFFARYKGGFVAYIIGQFDVLEIDKFQDMERIEQARSERQVYVCLACNHYMYCVAATSVAKAAGQYWYQKTFIQFRFQNKNRLSTTSLHHPISTTTEQ